MKLTALKYEKFCQSDVDIDATMIIVICEVALLIMIICKLIYDVRHYNRTGELPWLARHISPYGCCCFSFSSLKSAANQNTVVVLTNFSIIPYLQACKTKKLVK